MKIRARDVDTLQLGIIIAIAEGNMRLTCRDVLLMCIAISFCIIHTPLHAQAPDTLWTKTFGGIHSDNGRCVIQTSDGGYVMTGTTTSWGAGAADVYIIKTDSLGNTLWMKTYGGTEWDYGYSVVQTSDFGYVIAGFTNSFGVGGDDVYLLKTDSLGDTLWTMTYGDVNNDHSYSVTETSDGGYIVAGYTYGAGGADVYLVKTDSLGATLWTKIYGGPDVDDARSIALTADGGYIIVGTTYSFGSGFYDVYVIKTDSLGDTLWTRTYGGLYGERGYSVISLPNDDYVIAGVTSSFGSGQQDVYLIRIDSDGDTLWTKTYGGTEWDYGFSVVLSSDMGYTLVGLTTSFGAGVADVYIIKADSLGNLLWTKTYGGSYSDYGYSVAKTTDDGYITAGSTASFGAGDYDIWLLKMEPDVGVEEQPVVKPIETHENLTATIFRGPLELPEGKQCKVFDITGRIVEPDKIQPGIYFIEVDGVVTQKVVKVR